MDYKTYVSLVEDVIFPAVVIFGIATFWLAWLHLITQASDHPINTNPNKGEEI